MLKLDFPCYQYSALGNDFILFDRAWGIDEAQLQCQLGEHWVQRLCDRKEGIGADGILWLDADHTLPRLTLLNADGSDGQFSGNGARVGMVYLANEYGQKQGELRMGPHCMPYTVDATEANFEIDLAEFFAQDLNIVLNDEAFEAFPCAIGNPHVAIHAPGKDAPWLEKHAAGILAQSPFVEGANVHAFEYDSATIKLLPYERGVGLTLACGSGALAVAKALVHIGQWPVDSSRAVSMPGGDLALTRLSPSAWCMGSVVKRVVYKAAM